MRRNRLIVGKCLICLQAGALTNIQLIIVDYRGQMNNYSINGHNSGNGLAD
jgi:hypothetical protein